MNIDTTLQAQAGGLDPDLFATGAGDHPWLTRLANDPDRALGPDLADAIHWLAQVHGGAAGLVDGAGLRARNGAERAFLAQAFTAWQRERRALAALSIAVGPVPSTSGQVQDERTAATLADAIATLASSERAGVALGAAAALVVEWHGFRRLMNRAADRFSATLPPCALPERTELFATVAGLVDDPATERAVAFGARQLLVQHAGLVAMLTRRSAAREAG